MDYKGSSIISVDQFDRSSLTTLFELARRMRPIADRKEHSKALDGYILGNLFFEASTRTRMSFASAFYRLGGEVNNTVGVTFSSISKGESLEDTVRVIEGYCDIITIRHSVAGTAKIAADYCSIPVINGGDGDAEHPTQALLDAFTIFEEKQKIDGLSIAIVGDLRFGRAVHSLAKLLCLFKNLKIICIAPEALQMPQALVAQMKNHGFEVTLTDNFENGIKDVEVIYKTRIQVERHSGELGEFPSKASYILTKDKVINGCKKDVTILHPLPRLAEISTDVDELKQNAAYFRQAKNGLLVRMALFLLVLGEDNKM